MKKQLFCLGLSVLFCGAITAEQPKKTEPTVLKRLSNPVVGTALTAGFGYSLLCWYRDIQLNSKRYSGNDIVNLDNAHHFIQDAFTAVGLAYLTYKSGLFTLDTSIRLLKGKKVSKS